MDQEDDEIHDDSEILQSYTNQIAGHKHRYRPGSPSSIGLVKSGDCVLKPTVKPNQAHTEVSFYQKIWSGQCSELSILQSYVPKYYGMVTLSVNGRDVQFLKLQDLSASLKKPCIADIKIGRQTWEPNVDQQKRFTEDLKYRMTKEAYGISLTGYQVFDLTSGQFIRRDKDYGKGLDKDSLPKALKEFFNVEWTGSKTLIKKVADQLGEILSWWHRQKIVNIYGSSILILYDAWELESISSSNRFKGNKEDTSDTFHVPPVSNNKEDLKEGSVMVLEKASHPTDQNIHNQRIEEDVRSPLEHSLSQWIRVFMIDFAHVVYPYQETVDHNYINGLSNLLRIVQQLSPL